jgi:8-oxo-dGTP diphosphatase
MPTPKTGTSKNGKEMHYSVGALIEQKGTYLLIDRVHPPPGFAGPAGHIDEGEDDRTALYREIKEETGLTITSHELLFDEEVTENVCHRKVAVHYWKVFSCTVTGELQPNKKEAKSINWYTPEEIQNLNLEPVWVQWFKKLKII